ncbi:MAG: uridine phosphorylase [Candidatus Bathyarchaeia archaeon]|jgi:uridine phosphorylase
MIPSVLLETWCEPKQRNPGNCNKRHKGQLDLSRDQPEASDETQYHISAQRGQIGSYVFLPGDPDRVPKIAKLWDSAHEVSSHRQYKIWTGTLNGMTVSACSTGIGCPSTSIAIEELGRIGADTFIRVGSCGSLIPDLECGNLAISTAAVRLDGTSKQYVEPEYPAAASLDVTLALVEAAQKLGKRFRVGYTASADSYYVAEGRPGVTGYLPPNAVGLVERLRSQQVITMEMEASTIFTLASLYGFRSGCILAVYANRATDTFDVKGEEDVCQVAVEAVRILTKWDADKRKAGKKQWSPSLSF